MEPRSSSAAATATSSSPSSSSSPSPADAATPEPAHAPPRRRLVKASTRAHLDDLRKRDAVAGSAPPGFAPPGFGGSVPIDRVQSSSCLTNVVPMGGPSPTPPGPLMTGHGASGFRDRDRGISRPSNKDFVGDHQAGTSHGSSKPGRPPHISNPAAMETRPLGRRAEVLRRHDSSAQKHMEEIKNQQAKRAALVRAQQAGATGCFKSFDSQFNNFLVPVIPMQFLSKTQSHSTEMG